ncbi:MAG TPA: membrane dipeptidase [Bacteroidetes bacterium]|nr:membrane dipeptidase [Bacteroidota bacterium]
MKNNLSILLIVFLPFIFSSCGNEEARIAKKADRIHRSVLTVDTHCDTPMRLMRSDFDLGVRNEDGSVDFPRMEEGGLDAEFFAVFIGQGPRDGEGYKDAYERAVATFEKIYENLDKNSVMAELAFTVEDACRIKKSGKRIAFLGIENGYPVGKDLSKVEEFYKLGARYITLSHSRNNDICDSSTDDRGAEHNGLSEFGEDVVREMNRLGMMVDVSHISDEAFYDVINLSNAPVIASHSSCRALCESPRNLDDDMLMMLKENGGVIQICILSSYLKQPEPNPVLEEKLAEIREKYNDFEGLSEEEFETARREYYEVRNKYRKLATVEDAVDHIDHVVQLIGIDHVGIGTDFDGGGGIEGMMDVSQVKNLTHELLRRGYSKSEIEKIWGGNVMRVLRENEKLAEETRQKEGA